LKYLFGIGRELEEKGNMILASLMFSKCDYNNGYDDFTDYVRWKAKNNVVSTFTDYYWNYLNYIDAAYTIPQMQEIIKDIASQNKRTGFEKWLYSDIFSQKDEFYKILGAKYMRENKLLE